MLSSTSVLFTGCKPNDNLTPDTKTLTSIIDTIIPSDEFAGAIEIGLDKKLQQHIEQKPKFNELITRILVNVTAISSQRHKTPFFELNIDQREFLLNNIIADNTKPLVRRDLVLLRNTLLPWYYQSKAGAASIGFVLPANYPAYYGTVR